MFTRSIRRTSILLTLLAVLALTADAEISAEPAVGQAGVQAAISDSDTGFRTRPVMFIENAGQWENGVRFQLWGGNNSAAASSSPAWYVWGPGGLADIAVLSASDAWGVGSNGMIRHWNGQDWIQVASPVSAFLNAVAFTSPSDGWAVGNGGTIIRWNGLRWLAFSSGPPNTVDLKDVAMLSPNRGWAVGVKGWSPASAGSPLMLSWDGSAWREIALPASVAQNSDNALEAGVIEAPAIPSPNWLNSITMVSQTDGWVVGAGGRIYRWNGASWSRISSPTTSHLHSVSLSSANDGWAVGGNLYGLCRTMLHWNGSTWRMETCPVSEELLDVSMVSPIDGWAVGYKGTILHWDGIKWAAASTPTDEWLGKVVMVSASDGWIAGQQNLLRYGMAPVTTYSVSGRVTDASGHGIPGVTAWASSSLSTTTNTNGDYTFTGLPAGTYNLRAEKTGYAICPHSRPVTVPPSASGQDFTGLPTVVNIAFCPSSDGYKFSNSDPGWGVYPSPPASGDFTMEDMRRMFGDQAVCIPPAVPGLPCSFKLSAWSWYKLVNSSMNKGHCAGMAATSLRFFMGLDQPADFQAGATNTFGLDLIDKTRRSIAYYHVEQSALPILPYKLYQQLTSTPARTLDALRTAMSSGALDPVVLVLKSGDNQHAVTPIAVEDRGGGLWAVWAYDNEHPGVLTLPVEINTVTNTWRRGAWSGDAASHSLYTIPMSLFNGLQICPFCIGPIAAGTSPSETASGQIWLTENANLLITDSLGRRLGYVGDQFVSEIPDAGRVDFMGGTAYPATPLYSIPLAETYTMLLDGQRLTQAQTLKLAQFGPGYAVSVENLLVSPTTSDQLFIAVDGSQLRYRANATKKATLTLAQDGVNDSYQLSLRNAELHASKTITLTNDISAGRLVLVSNPEASNRYDLAITRATATAGVTRFYHADLAAVPGDVQSFDYGTWDGVGSLVMQIDHGGDGTIDETRVLQNQIKKIYLPLISRR